MSKGNLNNNIKFWDRVSKLYTPLQEKSNQKVFEKICDISKDYIKDKNVLEIACGTGQITCHLSKYAKKYNATDFSNNMIAEAKKRKIDNANFSVEDATNLTYGDSLFDTVIIANALHIMPNPQKAMEEIRRVLKPCGILIAPTFVYEGKINKLRLFFIRIAGFKTFHKWTSSEFEKFISSYKFETISKDMINANPLSEFVLISKNIKE